MGRASWLQEGDTVRHAGILVRLRTRGLAFGAEEPTLLNSAARLR
jgi:hypothetical protein